MTNVRRQPGRSPNGEIYVYGDDRSMLDSAVAALQFEFGPNKVRGTSLMPEAAEWLRDGQPVALVASAEGSAGLVCAARSRHKRLPIILLADEKAQMGGEAFENARILSRKFTDRELPHAIEQLLPGRSTPRLGFRDPSKLLAELLQVLTHVGYGGTVCVASPDDERQGHIGLRNGRVIHAQVGDESGMDALLIMASWRGCEFTWRDEIPESVNVNVSEDDLAAHVLDQDVDEMTDEMARLLKRSAPADEQEHDPTPFPRTPAPGAGNTDTEVTPISAGGAKSEDPADPDALPHSTKNKGERNMANNVEATLADLSDIDGFIAAALVDADSGMSLGTIGGNDEFDIDVAPATNTEVVKAKMRAARKLELEDGIDDILITLDSQYHLIRPLDKNPHIFFYLALNREKSNLAMSRMSLSSAEKAVEL